MPKNITFEQLLAKQSEIRTLAQQCNIQELYFFKPQKGMSAMYYMADIHLLIVANKMSNLDLYRFKKELEKLFDCNVLAGVEAHYKDMLERQIISTEEFELATKKNNCVLAPQVELTVPVMNSSFFSQAATAAIPVTSNNLIETVQSFTTLESCTANLECLNLAELEAYSLNLQNIDASKEHMPEEYFQALRNLLTKLEMKLLSNLNEYKKLNRVSLSLQLPNIDLSNASDSLVDSYVITLETLRKITTAITEKPNSLRLDFTNCHIGEISTLVLSQISTKIISLANNIANNGLLIMNIDDLTQIEKLVKTTLPTNIVSNQSILSPVEIPKLKRF